MRSAFEHGVNFYDTADAYGEGLAETVMGRALHDLPRDQIVLATKVFWHWFPDGHRYGDLSRDYILTACENSLRRLQTDYIDLYQCHSFDPLNDVSETVEALEALQKQGKIRFYGVSNWTAEQMRLGHAMGAFATCQPSYSLLNRGIESDILPYCRANDVGVLVYSPLHRGLLTGKYTGQETFEDHRKNAEDFQGERFQKLCERVARLAPIAQKYDLSITQLVLVTTLMHSAIDCAIVGIKTPEQIEEAAGAMGKTISTDDWHQVRGILSGS
jgi:aryl-alcohol dehydrogenase-like predicted oxidoreductase